MSLPNWLLRRRPRWFQADGGQTLVEYGLIIGGVSLAIIAVLIGLAPGGFSNVVNAVLDAMTPG